MEPIHYFLHYLIKKIFNMVEEYSSKVDVPMGIFEIPAEEKKARGILKTSYGKIFLQFGREINSTRNMKKQNKKKKKIKQQKKKK